MPQGGHQDDNTGSSPMTATLVTALPARDNHLSNNGLQIHPLYRLPGHRRLYLPVANPSARETRATVTLTVQPTVPTANNDHGTGYYNTTLMISAPVCGSDSNGQRGPLTASLVQQPVRSTFTFHTDGSTYVEYWITHWDRQQLHLSGGVILSAGQHRHGRTHHQRRSPDRRQQ